MFDNPLNQAYWERNQLVAALSKIYPSWREHHPEKDKAWEPEWRNIVFVQTPGGQCSWHFHENELPYFMHLEFKDGNSWDGHTVNEKYNRLRNIDKI